MLSTEVDTLPVLENERDDEETIPSREQNPFGLPQQEVYELGVWRLSFIDGPANPDRVDVGRDADTVENFKKNFGKWWSEIKREEKLFKKAELAHKLSQKMGLTNRDIFDDWKHLKAGKWSRESFEYKYKQPLSDRLLAYL